MVDIIKPKRSTVASAVPTTGDLQQGEIAINLVDRLLFVRDHLDNIVTVGVNDLSGFTTDDLAEGSNLYWTQARFDAAFAAKDTDDLSEGSTNLYWTETRFDNSFAAKTTTDLAEGTNLYYTDERVDDRVAALLVAGTNVAITYDDGANTLTIDLDNAGGVDLSNNTTDDLAEGTTNLYYTDTRAQAAITGGTGVDVTAGVVSIGQAVGTTDNVTFNDLTLDGNLIVNGSTTTVNSTTLEVGDNTVVLNSGETGTPSLNAGIEVERGTSTNVSFLWDETNDRWTVGTYDMFAANFIGNVTGNITGQVSDISNHDTDDLSEGTTNLYFTDERAQDAVAAALVAGTNVAIAYDDGLNTITISVDNSGGIDLSGNTTDDLAEGTTNLYFTETRARDSLVAGTGVTYTAGTGTIAIGQAVGTGDDVNFNSVSVGGTDIADIYVDVAGDTMTGTLTIDDANLVVKRSAGTARQLTFADENDTTQGYIEINTTGEITFGGPNPGGTTVSEMLLDDDGSINFTRSDAADNQFYASMDYTSTTDLPSDFSILTRQRADARYVQSAGLTTDDVTEGTTNLYWTQTRFDTALAAADTDDVSEGTTNLYWTQTRFDSAFGLKTTTDLAEGTNLYYTDERVDDRVAALLVAGTNVAITYDDGANTLTIDLDNSGGVDLSNNDTDDLAEGTTNLYYTDARARAALVAGTGVTYTSATGTIAIGQAVEVTSNVQFNDVQVDGNLTVNGTTTTVNSTTVEIGDNTILLNSGETGTPTLDAGFEIERGTEANVSWLWDETNDRWSAGAEDIFAANFIGNVTGNVTGQVSDISNHDTDDLAEGATNLYHTTERVQDVIGSTIIAGTNVAVAYDDNAGTFTISVDNTGGVDLSNNDTDDLAEGTTNLYYTEARVDANFATKDTDDLTEGTTNLYFTDERVDDRVSNLLVAGTGITLTYDDGLNTLTIASHAEYNSSDFDTDFAAKTTDDLTEGTTNLYFTNERAIDAVAGTLTEGTNISITYVDGDDITDGTITVALDNTGGFDLSANDTDDLSEGTTNLYYTEARFDTSFSGKDTDDLSEGTTNLYFTDERVDDRVAALVTAGTNISVTYDDGLNTLTISAAGADLGSSTTDDLAEGTVNLYYTDARARAALSGGTGVTYTSGTGVIEIGQDVATTADVTFNDLTLDGNLTVNGTTTTVNSTTVEIGDNTLLLNSGETGTPSLDAGIEVERGTEANVSFLWDETNDRWTVGAFDMVAANFIGNVTGQVSDISNHDTDDLAEGTTNLYWTQARFDTAFAAKDTDDLSEGTTNLYWTQARFDTAFAAKDTDDLTEGTTNLYHTTARVESVIDAYVDAAFIDNLDTTVDGGTY